MTGKRSSPTAHRPVDLREIREFPFAESDFAQACSLFEQLTGMTMVRRKVDLVYGRLIRRLRARSVHSFASYFEIVRRDPLESEQFVNALTTNLTSFFREPQHFPILRDHALKVKPKGELRVWCAAASTGEEPYSIAITLAETYGSAPPPAQIVATDLDTNVLRAAREGIYDGERIAKLDPTMLKKYFLRGKGPNRGRACVAAEIRDSVSFAPLNLLSNDWSVKSPFDAIFLRNVLIYFNRTEQLKVISRVAGYLVDDGLLFTGHSESLFYASHLFRAIGPTVYRKVKRAESGQ
jgi:chemotaxis protein methyltransferase CheR